VNAATGALTRLALVAVLALFVASVFVDVDGRRERGGHSDVAVVLGSRVLSDGTPSRRLTARLQRGLEVWRDGRAPHLIVSGGIYRGMDEAHAMKAWLLAHGVPDSVVTEDPHGRDTWETARFTRAWLTAHGGNSAIAVSQYFHLPRCRLAFHRHGIDTVGTAGPEFAEWRDLFSVPREVLGLVKYTLRPAPRNEHPSGGARVAAPRVGPARGTHLAHRLPQGRVGRPRGRRRARPRR
jgi:uncharacterized SAM-binding protein YcdF (DUF218 family)